MDDGATGHLDFALTNSASGDFQRKCTIVNLSVMKLVSLPIAALFALLLSLPAGPAAALVPDENCAIIVASRKSMPEVEEFVAANPQIDFGAVYSSRNGWLAISAGLVQDAYADTRLSRLKASGTIPLDSYCSDGEAYTGITRTFATGVGGEVSTPIKNGLGETFDARPMSREEKRFLQAALALDGTYTALLDGVWGSGSQAALERASWSSFEEEPTNLGAAIIMLVALTEFVDGDWEPVLYDRFWTSLLLPRNRIEVVETDAYHIHLVDERELIDVLIMEQTPELVGETHRDLVLSHNGPEDQYVLRRDDIWVTTNVEDGVRNYMRSHYQPGIGWVTVLVNYVDASVGAALMISSIAEGPGEALTIPAGSRSERHISEVAARMEAEEEDGTFASNRRGHAKTGPARNGPDPDVGPGESSGSGFFVDADGTTMTNAHVVEGCSTLTIAGRPADVIGTSAYFDIALLQPRDGEGADAWLPFAGASAALNADITIAGYPLHGLLGGLNVTRGTVTGLTGIGGDETTLQISAPVQRGNSGGPIVNNRGEVVGVVVAKLDAVELADATGEIPQNVNFAIRGEVAKLALSVSEINYEIGSGGETLPPEEIARRLQRATVLIECR